MDLFGVGSTELIVLLLLALIVLGPERLARSARELGKLVRNLKAYFQSFSDELRSELEILDEVDRLKEDLKG